MNSSNGQNMSFSKVVATKMANILVQIKFVLNIDQLNV